MTYAGPVYFDDVRFIVSTNPVIRVRTPQRDATISVPAGQTYTVSAQACSSLGRAINSVHYQTPRQSGPLSFDASSGLWTAPWDLWREGDGLRTLTLSATDSAGGTTSTGLEILVQNSGLRIHLLKPRFDQVLRGMETVTASVAADTRFGQPGVQLEAGDQRQPMQLTPQADGTYLATARLDTCRLPDGVHSVRVVARDSRFTVSDVAAVQVQNRTGHWDVVGARGSSFAAAGQPFRFVGWNEYDLFARKDQTIDHLQLTGDGTVLQKGTMRTWQGRSIVRCWRRNGVTSTCSAPGPSMRARRAPRSSPPQASTPSPILA